MILTILMVFLLPAGCIAGTIPEDLQIITEDYAPLNYMENGTLKGITVDLMEEIFAETGSNLTRDSFQVLPWSEGYTRIKSTPNTILFSMDRLAERENQFLWAGPIITFPQVLFINADATNSSNLDISNLRIVTLTDDCAKASAINSGADEKNIIEVPLAHDAIQLVENGSVDGWAYNELAGKHAIDSYANDPTRFKIGKELVEGRYYIAFHPDTSSEFVNTINTTLQKFKRDRTKTGVTRYEQIIARYLPVQCVTHSTSRESVIELVNLTAASIASDAQETIAAINTGNAPYRDETDPDLYVFVFDTNVTLMANAANNANNGKNLSSTTDVYGNAFRDEMITGALQNGTGWVSYVYSNPDSLGLYYKTSYYLLVNGSDGTAYVVGAGRYKTCDETIEKYES